MTFRYIALGLMLLCIPGCTVGYKNEIKHMQSDWSGLHRKITLYGATGDALREWETTAKVEDNGGTCYFLDSDGNAVIVAGTFVIEEL